MLRLNLNRILLFLFLIKLTMFGFTVTSFAKVPIADDIIGNGYDVIGQVLGNLPFSVSNTYRRIDAPFKADRVKRIVKFIQSQTTHNWRYRNQKIAILKQNPERGPNAYSSGSTLYVSEDMLSLLNDGELTAVIAHELAHAEMGHQLQRMVFVLGVPGKHLYNLVAQGINSYFSNRHGERSNPLKSGLSTENMATILMHSFTKTEMQADCFAYRWLLELQSKNPSISPELLNSATFKVLDISTASINILKEFPDDPVYLRFINIQSGLYLNHSCDLYSF